MLRDVKDVRTELAKYKGKDIGEEFQYILMERKVVRKRKRSVDSVAP